MSTSPDLIFADPELASLYDRMNPGRDDFDFYMPMIMAAGSVLDVGCGTGAMLHAARDAGHTGRLCGLDPAAGMIAQARQRDDIEWVLGDLASSELTGAFDLIVMTGHAFQVFIEDDALRAALSAIRGVLTTDGRFAFETRNPRARAWESWDENEVRPAVPEPGGSEIRMTRQITAPFDGELLSFSHTFRCDSWESPRVSHSTLRFLSEEALDAFLVDAGLIVEARFGDWDRSPVTSTSPEIITVARRG